MKAFLCIALVLAAAVFARHPSQDNLQVNVAVVPSAGFYFNYNVSIANPNSWRVSGNYTVGEILPQSPRRAAQFRVFDNYTKRFLAVMRLNSGLNITVWPGTANYFRFDAM